MGIGEATAKLFCLHGAKVVIVDIQDELAKTVCSNIGSEDIISFIHVVGGLAPHGYVAAKHAVVGLTKNGAAELGQYGVRVNCISMFASASPMATGFSGLKVQTLEAGIAKIGNLKGAVLKHEDTAQAAVFFASDESKYVSGHNFVIDGGFTIVNNAFGIFKQNAFFDHFKQDE